MSFGCTFKEESFGVAIISIGGSESLGPPPGGITLAQDPMNNHPPSRGRASRKKPIDEAVAIFFMLCKGSSKSVHGGIWDGKEPHVWSGVNIFFPNASEHSS